MVKGSSLPFIAVLAFCLCRMPATASVLFSDLGPPGNVYDPMVGGEVCGGSFGFSAIASPFIVAGSGSFSAIQIDLAVSHLADEGLATFDASIWTNVGGTPGVQVGHWPTSTSTIFGDCCGLVTIGATGVTLTGGASYFMVLGPVNSNDNSYVLWNASSTMRGESLINGGTGWSVSGESTFPAFDVLNDSGVPEPGSFLLIGTGLIAILGCYLRKLPGDNLT